MHTNIHSNQLSIEAGSGGLSTGNDPDNYVAFKVYPGVWELNFEINETGVGSNANNFTPGGAMGRKGYANGADGIVVGERGPEVISPSSPVDITPNFALGGQAQNINFNICI